MGSRIFQRHMCHFVQVASFRPESQDRARDEDGHKGQQSGDSHPVDIASAFENIFEHDSLILVPASPI